MEIKQELLNYSYWEHFNFAKELALVLPLQHPKRIKIETEMNVILKQINEASSKECQLSE